MTRTRVLALAHPLRFGRRTPFVHDAVEGPAVASTGLVADLKLFAGTYALGFLGVLIFFS